MKYNLLQAEINNIQDEYKTLLKILLDKWCAENTLLIFDEITLFWSKKINIIRSYLFYEAQHKDTFIFTAAIDCGFSTKDYLPFLLLGKNHIYDDPLYAYSLMSNKNEMIKDFMADKIVVTIKETISLLENCNRSIKILPVRLLGQDSLESKFLAQKGEEAFCSLFNNITTIKEYFEKCLNLNDIEKYLHKDFYSLVFNATDDEDDLNFEKRFQYEKSELRDSPLVNSPDSICFYSIISGPLLQALDSLSSCRIYNSIPVYRYEPAFKYANVLIKKFQEHNKKEISIKIFIAYLLQKKVDRTILDSISLDKLLELIGKISFYEELFEMINKTQVIEDINVDKLQETVDLSLEKLYKEIKTIASIS